MNVVSGRRLVWVTSSTLPRMGITDWNHVQVLHLQPLYNHHVCVCRSYLGRCVSCWGWKSPTGTAASLSLMPHPSPSSYRERASLVERLISFSSNQHRKLLLNSVVRLNHTESRTVYTLFLIRVFCNVFLVKMVRIFLK